MSTNLFKMISFGLILILGACSQKTSNATSDSTPQSKSDNRPDNRPNKPRGERPTFSDLIAKMDQNKDGKLSESEVEGPLKNDFSKIDINNDGFITADEFKNAPTPRPRRGNQ